MESASIIRPDVFRLGTQLHQTAQPRAPAALFPLRLGQQGVHEVCETRFGDMAALTGFAMAGAKCRPGAVAWISQLGLGMEHGRIPAAGLGQVMAAPPPRLHVTARKPAEALWAIEEAIGSGAVALVVAEIGRVDFTASRRLALASSRHGVPVILLMPHTCEGSTAASARWRVAPRPSGPNRYDPRAPGSPRWRAVLERSRSAPHLSGHVFDVELNDETLSLTVVSGLADGAPPARTPGEKPTLRERRARG